MKIVILFVVIAMLYVLYWNGYLTVSVKKSVLFIGSMGAKRAKFASCTGFIKKIVRFQADTTYIFTLETQLTKGELTVELLDSQKQELMCLNSQNSRAAVAVQQGKRYDLVFHFQSATGRYAIRWD